MQKGFTLIEMIITIGILGVLASIILAIVNPLAQFQKSNDARRKSDLEQLQRALEQYYQDHGQYPHSSGSNGSPTYSIVDFSKINTNPPIGITWGNQWVPYMNFLPKDPAAGRTYRYVTDATWQTYWIYASLERGGKDQDACNTAGTKCPNVPGGVTCGGTNACNYGVSSPNTTP